MRPPGPGRLDLLDRQERRRADRLAGTPAGDVFVTSRAVQRLVGARYLGVPPGEVTTDRECEHCGAGHGRPRFGAAPVDYSVSHTDDWLLMAVAGRGLVGCDIERPASVPDPDGMAAVALTAGERRRYDRLPRRERAGWLLGAWTRKEAAMKLTGLGLRAPPNQVDVSGPTASAAAVPRWPADPIHLLGLDAPGSHVAALAATVPVRTLRWFALPHDVAATTAERAGE